MQKNSYDNALFLLQTEKSCLHAHRYSKIILFLSYARTILIKICWLSPSEHIFDTQLENLKRTERVHVPYNMLMNMSNTEIYLYG